MCLGKDESDHHYAERAKVTGFDAWPPPWPRPGLVIDAHLRQYQLQQAGHPVDAGQLLTGINACPLLQSYHDTLGVWY